MIHPATRHCDLCQNKIEGTFCQLSYPLDKQDLALINGDDEGPFVGILGLGRLFTPQPTGYSFELCKDCVDGILPMLSDLKRSYLERFSDERRKRAPETA